MNERTPVAEADAGASSRSAKRAAAARERELFVRWQRDGDKRARDELVRSFTPLARNLVRRYSRSSEPYDDLLQVAMMGLVKAIDRYDVDRGFSFQSFAVPTVLGEMRRYFRDSGWSLHVPRGGQERALALRSAHEQLMDQGGHAPTVEELAHYLDWPQEQVLEAMQVLSAYDTVSLDAPAPGAQTEDASFADSLGDDDPGFELVELDLTVASALREIEPRDRAVLRMRFAEELTQTQIAARIGVSQMQVSRLLRRTLDQLRELSGERGGQSEQPAVDSSAGVSGLAGAVQRAPETPPRQAAA
ncbi:MAG TPA: SigB/SigF/SigG family RNA polymerase sigma factor [Solirubrobacteraceae bacterium]|nr:SigB/SigF/SigG family RNA polymerase sigma factor [Solirubrobacteraceae bacterium]